MAWHKSWGNTTNGQKAVMKRGWYPLSYKMLDHPNLIKLAKKYDSTINLQETETVVKPNATSSLASLTSASIVTKTSTFSAYLDELAVTTYIDALREEQAKGLGQKQKYKEQKRQKLEQTNCIDVLNNITTISSSQLAINNL
jgi:hypothetical protein